jgi:murein DD-endopeptidase MepM/ murein hydrolase activator NlpD
MRTFIFPSLVAIAVGLTACQPATTSGSSGAPAASSAAASSAIPASSAPPASSAASADPAADGGAEQTPGQPMPAGSSNPVSSNEQTPVVASFAHHDPSDLIPGSGSGYLDRTVWSPNLCFPMADAGYANSQVYDPGGMMGPAGTDQCNAANYSLPWRDDFCETRGYSTPVCVSGNGHQGDDIRPASCQKAVHWALAAEDGQITDIGTYTVTLTASTPPHLVYRYLHMQMNQLAVHQGDLVKKGDHMGLVSNNFGSSSTTIHLHFEIRAGVSGTTTDGKPVVLHTFLPPYLSLLAAYQRKLDGVACQ